jgi:hypothetical protein
MSPFVLAVLRAKPSDHFYKVWGLSEEIHNERRDVKAGICLAGRYGAT